MSGAARGRFVWYDLLTTDPDAAVAFYREVVGWGIERASQPTPYTTWTRGQEPLGAVIRLPEGAPSPPHWLAHLATPDLEATLARAGRLGAILLQGPLQTPTGRRFAIVTDPQGAAIAFSEPRDDLGANGPPEPGDISWHELMTTDYRGAFDFYAELFGWEVEEDKDLGDYGTYRIFSHRGYPWGGVFDRTEGMPSAWLLYAMVADVDAASRRVAASGGRILNGPFEVPGGDRVVQCMDPQGAAFALHALGPANR